MKKTERLFHVLETMRAARKPITADRLARDLGVSERTIYRDVKLLIAQGLPIMGEAGVGYILAPEFDAPPLQFTHDELDVLSIGLRLAFRDGDEAMRAAAETSLSKIRAGLKNREVFDSISIYAPSGAAPASPILSVARHAIRNKSIVDFDYISLKDDTSSRRVKPLALLFFRDASLLAGYCEMREDFRSFRIDRITSFRESGERFTADHYRLQRDYYNKVRREQHAYQASMSGLQG